MKGSLKMYIIIMTATSLAIYQLSNVWILLCSAFNCKHNKHAIYINNILQDGNENVGSETNENTSPVTPLPNPTMRYLPPLYIITPTYRRPEQLAELTRLSHTLMLVPNVFWLVIEDAQVKSPLIRQLLQKTGIPFDHLTAPMPDNYRREKKRPIPKGVSNRNKGLKWIRENATDGVLYFADDDNSYDLEIFNEMRFTKRVSMWPVGLIPKLGVSSPILRDGMFIGFYDGWMGGRQFPVDMAGFAVSVKFLLQRPQASMPYVPGYEEDGFLKSLSPFKPQEIEPLASNCSKILVWHTQTKRNQPAPRFDNAKFGKTNIAELVRLLV